MERFELSPINPPLKANQICQRCGAVLTLERLYTCPDKECPQPDYPGRD